MSEVIDCSPCNLDSSLCFIKHSISHDAYKLNKRSDNTHLWCTPFPNWNQPVVPCPVVMVASWPAYWFLSRQVRWSGIPISLRIFHSLDQSIEQKWIFFLKLSHFYSDPVDVINLISISSAFSKSSLNIWKFMVMYCWSQGHVLAWRILSITLLACEMSAIAY